jgi:uncharacterized membrane protein (DUF485 family)
MLNAFRAGCPYPGRIERMTVQLAAVIGAFVAGVVLAELFGAASLGVAFGFGQIAFSLALGAVLLRA